MRLFTAMLAGLLGSIVAGNCLAEESIRIVKAEGDVVLSQQKPVRMLATGPDGRAVVKVGGAGYIVLEKNSKVEIEKSGDYAGIFRHVTGMIYYALNAINGPQRSVTIRMRGATLGVRGTRFLVADLPGRTEIGMRKGQVNVSSPGEAFEIHRKAQADEFEAFKKEARDAIDAEKRSFEEYKANTEREFIEYKREFNLDADRMVSFDGNRVTERALGGESQKNMESLEGYGAEWLKEVRD